MGFNFKKVLGTVAPFLTAALPGPFGGLANAAIASALGMKPDTPAEQVQQAMATTPLSGDQLVALQKAEKDFQLQMEQLGFADTEKLAQIAADDRDSARKREVSVKDWTPRILAYSVTIGFFGILVFMALRSFPPEAHDAIMIMVGTLQSAVIAVMSYYFGSSSGDAAKTDLLAKAPAITDQK